jgi:quercetin dioxygenase-like cupin family protein
MNSYIRPMDESRFNPDAFSAFVMANRETGSANAEVRFARVPPHGSAPDLHTHPVDKFFFVLSGTMNLELDGQYYTAGPNTLVLIPAGIPHRNWNEGEEPEVHMLILAPHPPEGVPFTQPVAR